MTNEGGCINRDLGLDIFYSANIFSFYLTNHLSMMTERWADELRREVPSARSAGYVQKLSVQTGDTSPSIQ